MGSLLTRLVAQDFAHGHYGSEFERLEECGGREGNVAKRFVLAPTTQHVRDGRKRVFVNDCRLTPAGLQVQH
jgi:hypothetical protein